MVLYLLATVRGQVESENCEEGDTHTGYDDVNSVEQCLAPHRDVERNVKVRLVAACVEPLVPVRNHMYVRSYILHIVQIAQSTPTGQVNYHSTTGL